MIHEVKISTTHIYLLIIGLLLAGCNSQQVTPLENDVLSQAASEATAIIQQAQATALVLQAQAQATDMVSQASAQSQASGADPTLVVPVVNQARETSSDSPTPEPAQARGSAGEVRILRVSYAAEGGFIMVRYLAPPEESEKWWQGDVSVTDEASGNVYNEIPVMPKIGPLIGRPKREGQIGYVMLMNTLPQLQPGSSVTVQLGNYKFEHIAVE